ncbi:hypothetical protein [Pedobacter zeae]|uniref:Nucleotide-diphospho-sugar transferase n=1 Tax=Pedobacter zeae TaxID=1737356 RepID=A0A7W6P6C7_9SPHI|nr:hypothetical protein [Pedobacter zeae]MBB4107799.1 hypothetical protein [Pedobacter zeae]GGG96978.1 hypothetical protein GCM10007422_08570 [Pedobacter zeae]
MDKSRGVLYVATGKTYIEEAIFSATSSKKNNPYPIALITDSKDHQLPENLFDFVIVKEAQYSYIDKLLLEYTPFEQTIFLDTDTFIADRLDDLFRILDYREFAIHQADEGYEYQMPDVSNAMPEFNTGVIAYRLTENVKTLIRNWKLAFQDNTEIKTDQYHLRKTLYESDVKFAVFSSAYNFIIYYPNFVIQKVKVVHGRPLSLLPKIGENLNRIRHNNAWRRTYFPYNHDFGLIYQNMKNEDILKLIKFNLRTLIGNFKKSIMTSLKMQ